MGPDERLQSSDGVSDGAAEWPAWADEVRRSYLASDASVFLLHGVRDIVPYRGKYLPLSAMLHQCFCGDKVTALYDIASGITFPSGADEKQFRHFVEVYQNRTKTRVDLEESYRPEVAIPLLESFLVTRDGASVIIDYVDKLAPREEEHFMSFSQRRVVTALRRWATNPQLVRRNSFVFMIADSLADVHDELHGRLGGARTIQIPLPDGAERLAYIEGRVASENGVVAKLEISPEILATNTDGLSRSQIGSLMDRAAAFGEPVTVRHANEFKREVISSEIGDLIAFTQPRFGLEAVAGVDQQKDLLLNIARALREGRSEIVPSGVLLAGPPGCGKTFTMQCFAHDAGIPFVELRNIFSKYVGSTEANLERVFHYLEAMAPAFVFIDEFDQSYGRRVTSDSDSGVSRRVFARFNSFLSDESHQGRILFGAATNRPDLIDPSTMRAGRFDVKLPFLLPDEMAREAILGVSLQHLGVSTDGIELARIAAKTAGYSGADLKEVCEVGRRVAAFAGRDRVAVADLEFAVEDYIAPTDARGDEIEYMELLAVAACTSRSLLPERYVERIADGSLYARLDELKYSVH